MESGRALLASFVLAALAAQALVECRTSPMEKASQGEDVKKPDCVPGMDPRTFPGTGGITPVPPSHGGGITPVPSHGGYVPTPSHGGGSPALPTPAHGGSSSGSSPTSPSTGGGGSYGGSPSHGASSPSTPGGGAYGGSPSTPGGGGAYGSGSSPASPAYGGGGAYGGGSPAAPAYGGIGTSSPTPFVVPVDPHSLGSRPGSCDFWRSHPMEIWSAVGGRFPSTSTMGDFFGGAGAAAGGAGMSIQDALANPRSDGAGALLREGAAALLNSMTRAGFPYTTAQVRDAFAAQAAAFRKANEGK